jgi:acetoin utilization protein AcuB
MNPETTRVREIMETEVAVLSPDERLDLAEDVMRLGRIRHLPVVENGRVVGVVSSRDLLASSLSQVLDFDPKRRRIFLRSIEVKEVMASKAVTVAPEASLREAGESMLRHRIGCLPVAKEDGALIGLVTETDLLRALVLGGDDAQPREEPKKGNIMDIEKRLANEIDDLRRVRDELRVKIHLGKAEAKDLWEKTEHKLHEAEAKLKSISEQAEEPLHDIGEAARLLLDEVRDGYKRIRAAL